MAVAGGDPAKERDVAPQTLTDQRDEVIERRCATACLPVTIQERGCGARQETVTTR